MSMHTMFGVALGFAVIAPFLGRWRAKVWLKNNVPPKRQVINLPQPELREPSA
jgi:hypothetical protein